MKSKKPLIITLLIFVIALAGGALLFQQQQAHQEQIRIQRHKAAVKRKKTRLAQAKKLDAQRQKSDSVYQNYKKDGLTYPMVQKAKTLELTAIGDSVMLGSEYGIQEIFPKAHIDADVSRQAGEIGSLINDAKQNGTLANTILIGLGTNGEVTSDIIKDALNHAGKNRKIFWITSDVDRPWEKSNNLALTKAAKKYKNFHVIDWKKFASQNGDETWFSPDGVHPSVKGQEQYYTFIAKNILQKTNKKTD